MCIVEFFYSKEETGPASMKQNISSHRCIITLSAAVTAASRKMFSFPVLFCFVCMVCEQHQDLSQVCFMHKV